MALVVWLLSYTTMKGNPDWQRPDLTNSNIILNTYIFLGYVSVWIQGSFPLIPGKTRALHQGKVLSVRNNYFYHKSSAQAQHLFALSKGNTSALPAEEVSARGAGRGYG